jgi:hypothetical protein
MLINAKTVMLVAIVENLETRSPLVNVPRGISAKMALQLPSKLAVCQISTVLQVVLL